MPKQTTQQKPKPRFIPEMGAPYRFTPAAFIGEKSGWLPERTPIPRTVTGKITYINWAHSYFTVTYTVNGYELRESIKF